MAKKFKPYRPARASGFTLIELMITVVIAGIIISIAVPNMQDMINSGQLTSSLSEFQNAIKTARGEAVARNTAVTLCAANSTNPNVCSNANNWEDGYLIATSEPFNVISIHEGMDDNLALRSASGSGIINFLNNGLLRSTDAFSLCDDSGNAVRRGIVLSSGGSRPATISDTLPDCP